MCLECCDSEFGPILIIPKRDISYHILVSKEEGVNGVSRVSHHRAALHPAKSILSEMTKAESKEGPQL